MRRSVEPVWHESVTWQRAGGCESGRLLCRAAPSERKRQMGPAFLPTPLSPARGWSHPCTASSEPSALHWSAHTWRPMSHPRSAGLATGLCGISSPALAPASGVRFRASASPGKPKPPVSAALRSRLAEAVSHLRSVALRTGAFASSPHFDPAGFPACPVPSRRSHLKRGGLHLAEASFNPSLDERVDRCHRHPWDQNYGNFKALRPSVPVASGP